MSDTNSPSVPDLLLRIMQQQDAGFAEIRQSQARLGDVVNRIDMDLALLKRDMSALNSLPDRVNLLERDVGVHNRRLNDAEADSGGHGARITGLEGAHQRRSGWEMPFGKGLYLIGGAVLAFFGGLAAMMLRQ